MFKKKIDAYIITSPANRTYFTKIQTSFGVVVLTQEAKLFFTDFRYEIYAQKSLPDFDVRIISPDKLYDELASALKALDVKTVGYEEKFLTVGDFKLLKAALDDFTLKPASDDLAAARAIKTDEEIEKIIASQRIAEKALEKIIPLIKPGVTEREVSAELMFEMIRLGADSLAFENILSFG